jgi:methylmalonyl-CoA mutase N-terminal domain/subunit
MMKERFGAKDNRSLILRFSTGAMGSGLTEQEPLNNIARIAYYALAAALAGTRSMNLPCYDEVFGIPTQEAIRTSLRIQQILAHETGITDTVDPLGGSYYVDTMTNYFEREILKEIEEVERAGGIVTCVENGIIQRKLAVQAYEVEKKVQEGEIVKVGLNQFTVEERKRPFESFQGDPTSLKRQLEKLERVKAKRDEAEVKKRLERLQVAVTNKENTMPSLIDVVRSYASVGEIVGILKEVYGEAEQYVF